MVAASGSIIMLVPTVAFDCMVLCIISCCAGVIFMFCICSALIAVAISGLALSSEAAHGDALRGGGLEQCGVVLGRDGPHLGVRHREILAADRLAGFRSALYSTLDLAGTCVRMISACSPAMSACASPKAARIATKNPTNFIDVRGMTIMSA